MTEYNIGAVAKLTGISVHNLRVWEKRYDLQPSGRSPSGRRVYSTDDVEHLTLIKRCIDLGHSIGYLANLNNNELQANLAELNQAQYTTLDSDNLSLHLTVVSPSPYPFNEKNLRDHHIDHVHQWHLFEELNSNQHNIDIALIDAPYVTEELLEQLSTLKVNNSPKLILLVYRIARREDLQRIRNQGIRTIRAPIETFEVEDILCRFVDWLKSIPCVQTTELPTEPIARKFSRDQLDKLAERPYNINCECPRHISEIIKGMEAFELYSVQCQNRNESDAALHAKIFASTSKARSMMEEVLAEVLETEGIDLTNKI